MTVLPQSRQLPRPAFISRQYNHWFRDSEFGENTIKDCYCSAMAKFAFFCIIAEHIIWNNSRFRLLCQHKEMHHSIILVLSVCQQIFSLRLYFWDWLSHMPSPYHHNKRKYCPAHVLSLIFAINPSMLMAFNETQLFNTFEKWLYIRVNPI